MSRSVVVAGMALWGLCGQAAWAQDAEPTPEEPAPEEPAPEAPDPAAESTEAPVPAANPIVTKDEEMAQWSGVYQRSNTTVKAGQYMGIAGGSLMVVGTVIGLAGSMSNTSDTQGPVAEEESGAVVVGISLAGTGYVAYTTGPALIAGGSLRQNKSLRRMDPSAPPPVLGYMTWGFWGTGRLFSVVPPGPVLGVLTDAAAYITGSLQYRKNRMAWDRIKHNAVGQLGIEPERPRVTVNVAPVVVDGARGFAVTGTF